MLPLKIDNYQKTKARKKSLYLQQNHVPKTQTLADNKK